MREQKFRAWDKQSKTMEYCEDFSLLEIFFKHMNDDYRRNGEYPDVMQYIGRKAKKDGRDIYEEDIVRCSISQTQHYKGVIKFSEGKFYIQTFWYCFNPLDAIGHHGKSEVCGKSVTKLDIGCEIDEVIGNSFEGEREETKNGKD